MSQDDKNLFVKVDYAPDNTSEELYNYIKSFSNYNLEDAISCILNNKLARVIAKDLKLEGKKVSNLTDNDFTQIVNMIKNMTFNVIETGSFESSQVTSGGALLDEFTNNLESKLCAGLYGHLLVL